MYLYTCWFTYSFVVHPKLDENNGYSPRSRFLWKTLMVFFVTFVLNRNTLGKYSSHLNSMLNPFYSWPHPTSPPNSKQFELSIVQYQNHPFPLISPLNYNSAVSKDSYRWPSGHIRTQVHLFCALCVSKVKCIEIKILKKDWSEQICYAS